MPRLQYLKTYNRLDQVLRRADLAEGDFEMVRIIECIQEVSMERVYVLAKKMSARGSSEAVTSH